MGFFGKNGALSGAFFSRPLLAVIGGGEEINVLACCGWHEILDQENKAVYVILL